MNDRVKKTVLEKLRREVLRAFDKYTTNGALIGIAACSIVVVYLLARLAITGK
jgi:hypothetical protein